MEPIEALLDHVGPDEWRKEHPFTPEFLATQEEMLTANGWAATDPLRLWLVKNLPCLFGRIAAKKDLLSYCILTDSDIQAGDERVRDRIQEARLRWTRAGFEGRKNGSGESTERFMRRCRRRGRFRPMRRLCGACAANPCFCGFSAR